MQKSWNWSVRPLALAARRAAATVEAVSAEWAANLSVPMVGIALLAVIGLVVLVTARAVANLWGVGPDFALAVIMFAVGVVFAPSLGALFWFCPPGWASRLCPQGDWETLLPPIYYRALFALGLAWLAVSVGCGVYALSVVTRHWLELTVFAGGAVLCVGALGALVVRGMSAKGEED